MKMCTISLYHFDCVTNTELFKIISGMNNTICSSDPFPTRLPMSHPHAIIPTGDSDFFKIIYCVTFD